MNEEIITMIVKVVLTIASVLITGYFIPWAKSKIDSTKYNDFLTLTEKCVEAANQLYTPEQWNDKKLYVLGIVANYAADHHVNITTDEINAIIEGFVISLKG